MAIRMSHREAGLMMRNRPEQPWLSAIVSVFSKTTILYLFSRAAGIRRDAAVVLVKHRTISKERVVVL
jgi:hypothetical protein